MQLLKLDKPRQFKFNTYYYNPADALDEDEKKRIKFRRIRHSKQASKANPVRLLAIVIILIFVIFYLQKKAVIYETIEKSNTIHVEDIVIVD